MSYFIHSKNTYLDLGFHNRLVKNQNNVVLNYQFTTYKPVSKNPVSVLLVVLSAVAELHQHTVVVLHTQFSVAPSSILGLFSVLVSL